MGGDSINFLMTRIIYHYQIREYSKHKTVEMITKETSHRLDPKILNLKYYK